MFLVYKISKNKKRKEKISWDSNKKSEKEYEKKKKIKVNKHMKQMSNFSSKQEIQKYSFFPFCLSN